MSLTKLANAVVAGVEHNIRHATIVNDWDGEVDDMCELYAHLIVNEHDLDIERYRRRFIRFDELRAAVEAGCRSLGLL